VLAAALGTALTYALTRSRLGLRLIAIKDDEVAAQAAGINTYPAKVAALCISAIFAAVGGGLYVWNIGYLDPQSAFHGNIELQTVLMVLAGGIGTVWGPVIGGVVMSIVGTLLWARFPMEQQIVLGALTIAIAVFVPGGLMAALNQRGWLVRKPIWSPPKRLDAIALPASPSPPSGEGPVLVCKDLHAQFGGVFAVNGVSLEARAGQMLAIIGPNGAGKSTVFNLISSFLRGRGEVHFAGSRVDGLPPHMLACNGIARTFQMSRLFASLTVWETVLVAASSVHRSRAVAIYETTRVLEETELIDHWAELPDALPPGRQRLLEIARALALKPRVLLLDEAMAGMSPQEIERVHVVLKRAMARGCAVVAIEHVLPAIADLSSNAQVLDFGRTIAEGAPRKVLRDPIVIEAYMGAEYAGSAS
jgi:branched-chain amino acid transport system permease protein